MAAKGTSRKAKHSDPLVEFCRSLAGATEDVKWGDSAGLPRKTRKALGLDSGSRLVLLAAVALALGACVYDNHARWWIGDVAPDWHDCRAVAGSHAVLDLKRFRSILVIPFAWGGSRLFVLTQESHLQPGTTLTVPSAEARAILCSLNHGAPGDAITDVHGTVQVMKRRGQDVLLRLDLEGNRGYWSHRGKQWFERQGTPVEPPRSVGSP